MSFADHHFKETWKTHVQIHQPERLKCTVVFVFFRANNSDIPLADPIAVVTIDPPNRSADWNLSWLATKPCQTQWNIYDATTARNRQTHYVARAFSTMPRAYRQLPNNQPPKWTRPTRQIR